MATLPWKPFVALGATRFASAFALTMLFPFIGFMVQDLGVNGHEVSDADRGYYVGFLAASYMAGRVVTSAFWGSWSDKIGRKPVLYVGLISNAVLSVAFGFSFDYFWALAVRFTAGLLNGIVATCKTTASELAPDKLQAKGLSIMSVTQSLGLIAGSALGGILARPADNQVLGAVFDTQLWRSFPYLLPSLFCTLLNVIATGMLYKFLPETSPGKLGSTRVKTTDDDLDREDETEELGVEMVAVDVLPEDKELLAHSGRDVDTSIVTKVSSVSVATSTSTSAPSTPEPSLTTSEAHGSESDEYGGTRDHGGDEDFDEAKSDAILPSKTEFDSDDGADSTEDETRSCICTKREVAVMITTYCAWSFTQIVFIEVLPLWSQAPRSHGGLGMGASDVGMLLGIIGAILLLFQLVLFPKIANYLGPRATFRTAAMVQIPGVFLVPFIAYISNTVLVWVALLLCAFCRYSTASSGYTSIAMLLNNTVPRERRGAVNGMSMMVGSIAKAIGPMVGGPLFAWSINSGLPFPLNSHFVFILIATACLGCTFLNFVIPKTLDTMPKQRPVHTPRRY